jgi:hypothetical protein
VAKLVALLNTTAADGDNEPSDDDMNAQLAMVAVAMEL